MKHIMKNLFKKLKRFTHDKLDWGYPVKRIGGDSFQSVYSCELCDGELLQDSNGDWFHSKI